MAGMGPGPFAGMLLADLGAEVLRVDRPGVHAHPGDPRHDVLGRGKRSVALDLKRPRAAEVVRRLAARADVMIEGFRPGVAERLGIGPQDCQAVNPALVYGRMTGWGQDGPLAGAAGHDITYLALSGVLHAIGPADGPPVPPLNLLGDYGGGGMLLAFGVLAAAWSARRTGAGQVVDASIVDGAALLAAQVHGLLHQGMWADRRGANLLDGAAPNYGVYTTADGRHLAVGPLEPKFWAAIHTTPPAGRRCARGSPSGSPPVPVPNGWPSSTTRTPAWRRYSRCPRRPPPATLISPRAAPSSSRTG
jgi:alpha-methylacyl-CoA racemase